MICSTQLRWLHFWHRSFYLITAFASPTASAEGRTNRAGRTDTVAAAASNMLSAAALPLFEPGRVDQRLSDKKR